MKRIFYIILFLAILQPVYSQAGYFQFYQGSKRVNTAGMAVLGGWATVNLISGARGWSANEGADMYYHQMNFYWNTVNLAIAGVSFYSLMKQQPLRMSPQKLMENHVRYERIFLINAGLDIGYMGAGFLMRNRSEQHPTREEMLLGYGNSLLLQGGFLFVFDGVMYLVQRVRRFGFMSDLTLSYLPRGGAAISYTHVF